ncbi:MAG: transcriptional regulator, partial [Gammaproteobacteria bacterium]|nr:transcriptional regulator [Gammaproteobacteria bacterium]
ELRQPVATMVLNVSPPAESSARPTADATRLFEKPPPVIADGLDLSLPSQPSVAVLPFFVLSSDPAHGLICDGLTHDVITLLGRARWLFVSARGSVFQFNSGPRDTGDIARKLGVRYVVEGSAQFAGQRVRVNAALTDTVASNQLWAECFEGSLDDIFTLQDDIAAAIVGSVETEIEQAERQRTLLTPEDNLDAWSAYHRGCWHMYQFTPEGYDRAEHFFKRSVELGPNSARPLAGLSFVQWQRVFLDICRDRDGYLERAFDYAWQSLALDPRDPLGHWALGRAFILRQDLPQAIQELETSVQLNPSFAVGQYSLSFALMHAGEAETSTTNVIKARRLSPYDPLRFAMLCVQASNLALQDDTEQAAELTAKAVRQPNAHYHILAYAAFCHAMAGRDEAARDYINRLKASKPDYSCIKFFQAFPYQQADHAQRIRHALQSAGLPD